jgi:hypothetical protein
LDLRSNDAAAAIAGADAALTHLRTHAGDQNFAEVRAALSQVRAEAAQARR